MTLRKPRNWNSFDDLLACAAGQAYVAEQVGGLVPGEFTFRSSRNEDCSYDLYDDGSVWFHSNAEDEVWASASDFIGAMCFEGLAWDVNDQGIPVVDDMDRELLECVLGHLEDQEAFVRQGGVVIVSRATAESNEE